MNVSVFMREGKSRQEIRLGPELKRGGEGIVHTLEGMPLAVAKIYRTETPAQRAQIERRCEKILSMLARPPRVTSTNFEGARLPLLAWPTHVLEEEDSTFCGFLMPRVSAEQAVTLNDFLQQIWIPKNLSENERCLTSRLVVCRSLAGIVADLHAQGHFVVDVKPENLFIFRRSCIPCFLDNDGFSIAGESNTRFTAFAATPGYTCPELLSETTHAATSSGTYDEPQDRFALAVLLFQLLNQGIHPFQGVLSEESDLADTTLDSNVVRGWYAYGLTSNQNVRPKPGSNHDCLPEETRALFDRAFDATSPDGRPSAMEWRKHLDDYLRVNKPFVRCKLHPESVLHIHFKGYPCVECRTSNLPVPAASTAQASAAPVTAPPASARTRRWPGPSRLVVIALLILITLAWYWFFLRGH